MSDFQNDYETLENMVEWRLEELFKDAGAKLREADLQTISVRLRPGDVAIIDHMAKQLEWTRQQFLARVLDTSLLQLMAAFADKVGPESERMKTYDELMRIRYGKEESDA